MNFLDNAFTKGTVEKDNIWIAVNIYRSRWLSIIDYF